MIASRGIGAALTIVMLTVLTAVAPARVLAAPTVGDPDAWARACSAANLGLGKDTVARAPVLSGDLAPGGGRVRNQPASDGSWYPIVLVHGWTDRDTVASPSDRSGAFSHLIDLSSDPAGTARVSRSLLGQLQGLPGAAVFTFDYHPYSARWVDDEHLGPALGEVIDCLYKASGQKVVLVGHSMGGLISRWAATHPGLTGADRAGEISTVVTFGTPETGSVVALLAEVGVDFGAVTNNVLAVIRLILSVCGTLSSTEIETGTLCDRIWPPVRAFESSAGIALRYGSSQLAALDPWPKGIHVDALAGDTSFETPKVGWFNWPWATDKVTGAGDMIVTKGSAFAGADTTKSVHCDYQLNAIRARTDQLGLTVTSEVTLPLGKLLGACFHRSLMRSVELTNEALRAIREDLAARGETVHFIRAPIKTVTVNSVDYTGQTSDRVYHVSLWARTTTKKCAATATGEVAAYLASHYCREVRRNLATATVNGRRVLIAQSYAFFGNPPDWNGDPGNGGPPSYGYVSGFVKLVARDGTGYIRSLLDDGYRFANSGTATRYPNAFDTEGEDSGAETAEVWYLDGNTIDNDPDLTRLAKAVFLTLFD